MGTEPKPAAAKKPKRFKWPIRIAIVMLIYTVVGFFVVPAIIKSQMLKRLPALTKRQAAVEQVKCNPYVLSLTIRGFALKESNGDVFISFDEFYGNFQLWASLFKHAWVFDEISLAKPFAQVTYQADGNFNFANLLETAAATPKPPAPTAPSPCPPRSSTISASRTAPWPSTTLSARILSTPNSFQLTSASRISRPSATKICSLLFPRPHRRRRNLQRGRDRSYRTNPLRSDGKFPASAASS